MLPQGFSLSFFAYTVAYTVAAGGCLGALARARKIEDPDTRRGLVGMLAASGGWALSELGFLLAPTPSLAYALYDASLIIGLTTVGAWLYFTSAYTGRSFHRNQTYRRTALGVYLGIVAVKLTNPFHNLYFTTEFVTMPFPHLTIRHGILHWIVTGFSYTLVAIGFFMLYELFLEADYNTRPLAGVAGLTAVPVVFDIIGFASPLLIDINYEPLGVVVFALGTLYVIKDQFLAVQLTDGVDDAVIYLDQNNRIREFNDQAADILPALNDAIGDDLQTAIPEVASVLRSDEQILERTNQTDSDRFYLINDTSFSLGQTAIGQMIVISDVTATERKRRELNRHNQQLDGFAKGLRHELANTVQIANGHVNIAGEALDAGNIRQARTALQTVSETTDRMSALVEDFVELAKYGQTIDKTHPIAFEPTVLDAFETTDTDDLELVIDGSGSVTANTERLRELFQSAFEFARENNASMVMVSLEEDRIEIRDDGDPVGSTDPAKYFSYDAAVPNATAGLALPTLKSIAEIYNWTVGIDTEYTEGICITITGITTEMTASEPQTT